MDEKVDYSQVTDIISVDEVRQFYDLLKKMHKANAVLEQLEHQEQNESSADGVIPYEIALTITCDVAQKGSSPTISPTLIEKLQKVYYIDMFTDNYSDMIEKFLDKITDTLSVTCAEFIPPATSENTNV